MDASHFDEKIKADAIINHTNRVLAHDHWTEVRYYPSTLDGYDPKEDKLLGTEEYGEHNGDNGWGIKFDHLDYK